jgi:hypothetical protein
MVGNITAQTSGDHIRIADGFDLFGTMFVGEVIKPGK